MSHSNNELTQPVKHWSYRYRNVHGEVFALVTRRDETTIAVGFAFCNPEDFNKPRKERISIRQRIARKRLKRAPIYIKTEYKDSKGFVSLYSNYNAILHYLQSSPAPEYTRYGDVNGVFDAWFSKFTMSLKGIACESKEKV